MTDTDLQHSLLFLTHQFRRHLKIEAKKENLPMSAMHLVTLRVIERKRHCTAQNICNLLDKDKAQINRILNKLLSLQFIEKSSNPNDQRSQILNITQSGQGQLWVLSQIESKVVKHMTQGMEAPEIDVFIKIAQKMSHNLTQDIQVQES